MLYPQVHLKIYAFLIGSGFETAIAHVFPKFIPPFATALPPAYLVSSQIYSPSATVSQSAYRKSSAKCISI